MTNPTQPTGSALAALSVAEGLTDAELSALVAEHVLNWPKEIVQDYTNKALWGDKHWATSADAVLPLLEKAGARIDHYFYEDRPKEIAWKVVILNDDINAAHAPTFARAACLALLRATPNASERNATRKASREERG